MKLECRYCCSVTCMTGRTQLHLLPGTHSCLRVIFCTPLLADCLVFSLEILFGSHLNSLMISVDVAILWQLQRCYCKDAHLELLMNLCSLECLLEKVQINVCNQSHLQCIYQVLIKITIEEMLFCVLPVSFKDNTSCVVSLLNNEYAQQTNGQWTNGHYS